MRQSSQPLSCRQAPVHGQCCFHWGKSQPQQEGWEPQNQAAPTQGSSMGATNLSLCFSKDIQFVHGHWTPTTGSHFKFIFQNVGKENDFFVFKSNISHSRQNPILPILPKTSCLSASGCCSLIFPNLLIRYKEFKGSFFPLPTKLVLPIVGITSISVQPFPHSIPPTAAHSFRLPQAANELLLV